MKDMCCIDAFSPTSSSEIKAYFMENLKPIMDENRDIIFLCIGTDRSTGDSLGPLIGYKLKPIISKKLYIYGSLESPIHATNILTILDKIKANFNNPYIVAIDAALGSVNNIGKVIICIMEVMVREESLFSSFNILVLAWIGTLILSYTSFSIFMSNSFSNLLNW